MPKIWIGSCFSLSKQLILFLALNKNWSTLSDKFFYICNSADVWEGKRIFTSVLTEQQVVVVCNVILNIDN